jgi:hypothetical protein
MQEMYSKLVQVRKEPQCRQWEWLHCHRMAHAMFHLVAPVHNIEATTVLAKRLLIRCCESWLDVSER